MAENKMNLTVPTKTANVIFSLLPDISFLVLEYNYKDYFVYYTHYIPS
jgi:hypothetical protein